MQVHGSRRPLLAHIVQFQKLIARTRQAMGLLTKMADNDGLAFFSAIAFRPSCIMVRSVNCSDQKYTLYAVQVHLIGAKPILR